MKDSERLKKVIDYLGTNPNRIAKELGLKRSVGLYEILNEKKLKGNETKCVGISKKMADAIVAVYPEILKSFLLTGEGPMTKTEINITRMAAGGVQPKTQIEIEEEMLKKEIAELRDKLLRAEGKTELLEAQGEKKDERIAMLQSFSNC